MVGDLIRNELQRSLEGNRRIVTEQRGEFTLRMDPEHVADCRAAIIARNIRERMGRARLSWTLGQNMLRFG